MEEPTLALLTSPLLGPTVWERVADTLADAGRHVTTVPPPRDAPHTPEDVVEHLLACLPDDRPVVLVPHSNAGLYVPVVAAHHDVAAAVFVDAGLPGDDAVPLAPPGLVEALRGKAGSDGLLPPWTQWWEGTQVAELFPDSATRGRVEREQARLPLRYFESALPASPGWHEDLAAAYLAFGDTYAEERAAAAARGWPTATIDGAHLHMLVDPVDVTRELLALLDRTGR